jgi:hypothetical protein
MWTTALALALSTTAPANACVALVTHDGGALATSEAQQVILEQTATGSVVEYANEYTGLAEDFGWIVVVPAPFVALEDGDITRFEALTELSQPRVMVYEAGGSDDDGGCGCGGAAKDGDALELRGGDTASNAVDIVAEGFTGTYGYTVVESDDGDGLVDWLAANDWVLGANEAAVQDYVADGGFAFVLIDLAPTAALGSGESRLLPPVRIESGSTDLMYPARMARDAAPEFQSTRIFVLGNEEAVVTGGWSAVELDWVETSGGQSPEDAFEQALWDATSDSATYARVFSGSTAHGWLTRFETRADRDVHTADVHFELSGGHEPMDVVVESWQRSVPVVTGAFGGLLVLGVPLLAVVRRRRE